MVARLRDTLVSGRHASRVLVLASRQNELLLGLDFFERLDAEIKVRDRETRSPTREPRALPGGICRRDYSHSPALRRKLRNLLTMHVGYGVWKD